MNERNTEQSNNGINNEEISSAKTLDKQNLSKEIKMENEQSYDVREVSSSSSLLETNHIALILCISDHRWRLNPQLHCFVAQSLMKKFCVQPLFFSTLGFLLSSFDQEFQGHSRFAKRSKIGGLLQ